MKKPQLSTRDAIVAKVNEIISDKLGAEPGDLKADTRFREDLGCDSLDEVELIMELEREFQISIPDSEVYGQHFATLGHAYTIVESHIRAGEGRRP